MLLNSPEALPPSFQNPKILYLAKDYTKKLRQKQKKAPSSTLLSPKKVVLEGVPRVLQGFWTLPPCSLLNMVSQKLSQISAGVTQAVLDRVLDAFAVSGHLLPLHQGRHGPIYPDSVQTDIPSRRPGGQIQALSTGAAV